MPASLTLQVVRLPAVTVQEVKVRCLLTVLEL